MTPPLAPPSVDPPARTGVLDRNVDDRAQRERAHFNARTTAHRGPLVMPVSNITRYDSPPADTPYSLEYAFHLLENVAGRRILNVGCGEGLDAVILASLGAEVVALDISDAAVAVTNERAAANGVAERVRALVADATTLPVASGSIDAILAAAVMHHVDIPKAAAELRRVLRPGGVAVFVEPLAGPYILQLLKRMVPLPKSPDISEDERPLTPADVSLISRTIGVAVASRPFGLTSRVVQRLHLPRPQWAFRIDRWVLSRSRMLAALASPLVWSVRKSA